ncbi:MAG: TIGR04150 pseudo-rSAM protein [Marinifilaceae bacterium]
MKNYWLYLNPETFLWSDETSILIYNSAEGLSHKFSRTKQLDQLTEQFKDLSNLYCIEITEKELADPTTLQFVDTIIESQSGNLTEALASVKKPIQLPPILNLQCDRKKLKLNDSRSIGENVVSYLNQVDIYLNSSTIVEKGSDYIPAVNELLQSVPEKFYIDYNIIIESSISPTVLGHLIKQLESIKREKTIHLHYHELENLNSLIFNAFPNDLQLKILVKSPIEYNLLEKIHKQVEKAQIRTIWNFVIQSEQEYEQAVLFINTNRIEDYELSPTYNGNNISFFEENIYLTEDDLKSPALNKREIFAHQAINTNNFGKLILRPNRKIYTGIHSKPVGELGNSLKEVLIQVMQTESSWFKIRNMEPCNNCVYQWLCPSPSDYEIAINKPNLCHIKN